MLGAGEKDQATSGDGFGHRDRPPAARGKIPEAIRTGSFMLIIAGEILRRAVGF